MQTKELKVWKLCRRFWKIFTSFVYEENSRQKNLKSSNSLETQINRLQISHSLDSELKCDAPPCENKDFRVVKRDFYFYVNRVGIVIFLITFSHFILLVVLEGWIVRRLPVVVVVVEVEPCGSNLSYKMS